MSERRGVCDIVIAAAGSTRGDGGDDDDAERIAVVDARHFAVFIYCGAQRAPHAFTVLSRALLPDFAKAYANARRARGCAKRGRVSLTVKYGMHRKPDGNMHDRRPQTRIDV